MSLILLLILKTVDQSVAQDSPETDDYDDSLAPRDSPSDSGSCGQGDCSYVPHSPFIPCNRVWDDFVVCDDPFDLKGNETARTELGYGCSRV